MPPSSLAPARAGPSDYSFPPLTGLSLLSLNHQPDLASLGESFPPSPDPSLLCDPSPPD